MEQTQVPAFLRNSHSVTIALRHQIGGRRNGAEPGVELFGHDIHLAGLDVLHEHLISGMHGFPGSQIE